jgi:hypothetical protein
VFGDPEFGLSLDQYLWSFSGGSGSVQQQIEQQIMEYVYKYFDYEPNTEEEYHEQQYFLMYCNSLISEILKNDFIDEYCRKTIMKSARKNLTTID